MGGARGAALSRTDAARLAASLRVFAPAEVGSAPWWAQRRCVERLNSAAHADAAGAGAVAVALAAAPGALDALVRELLLAEAWRDRVAPQLAAPGDAPRLCAYLALYHEAVLANLLEQLLLHADAGGALSDDALSELADYAVLYLTTDAGSALAPHEQSARALLDAPAGAELASGARDARLGAALSGLAALRALAQRVDDLPPGARARLLRDADAPAALLAALGKQPWLRKGKGGAASQLFSGGAWMPLPPGGEVPLSAPEGHAWLAVLALLAHACGGGGGGAGYGAAAQARALRAARRLLTPRALDGLPALTWLSRAAERADLAGPSAAASEDGEEGAGASHGALLLQAVPPWREPLLAATDWAAVAAAAAAGCFGDTPAAAEAAAREAAAAAALWDESLLPPEETAPAPAKHAASTPPPPTLLALSWRDARGEWAPAWEAALLPDAGAPPVDVSLASAVASAPAVAGRRWRLLPPPSARRVPPGARVRCSLGAAEAVLDLPAPPAAPGAAPVAEDAWAAAPAVLWATLGLLPRDGFALQLRLAKVESARAAGVDAATGAVMLYRLAGGALTLRV